MSGIISNINSKPEDVVSGAFGSYMVPAGKFAKITMSGSIVNISASATKNGGNTQAEVKSARNYANISFTMVALQVLTISTLNTSFSLSRIVNSGTGGEIRYDKSIFSRINIDGVTSNVLDYGFHSGYAYAVSSGESAYSSSSASIETYYTAEVYAA